ncbi:hypothetical protein [Flagellimonas allohymeniacidonis]|uniref:Uncharacterized protein n=1 Tax=Flagellimonas allohymeniacidonis TaxID=2517819 RepID=A0A4Q8QDJ0_9FLAO|nr:hypothetical protein [Allomuricauda hymeniacidonis]TAI48465.1 hypothetical protein EW142_01280 [Allomuricauda hymeniacidonis]
MKFNKDTAAKAGAKSSRKGIPNKSSNEIRTAFKMLVSQQLPNLNKWLQKVAEEDPAKALEIIIKFGDFIIPKLSRTEVEDVTFNIDAFLNMTKTQRLQHIAEVEKARIQKTLKQYPNGR